MGRSRRWEELQDEGLTRRGRARGDHSRPYPLSCFMATVLNGTRTSITASRHSEPSDSGRCRQKSCVDSRQKLSQERLLSLTSDHLSSTAQDTVPQSDTFNISGAKRGWVVVFPWFLCGQDAEKSLVSGIQFLYRRGKMNEERT